MSFLGRALAILRKDLKAEWRTKVRLSPMVFFILLMLLVFNFSFDLGETALREIGPGTLWSSYVFASLLSLGRSFAEERENDALDALLLAPGDRGSIYLGKMLGNFVFLLAVEILSLPFFALFFNLSLGFFLLPLLAVFVLGSACIASVGTLFAALSNNMRLRELMLPLLLFPMILPALISSVKATELVLVNGCCKELFPHLQMLGVYAVIFTVLSLMLFEYAIEE